MSMKSELNFFFGQHIYMLDFIQGTNYLFLKNNKTHGRAQSACSKLLVPATPEDREKSLRTRDN